MPPGCLRGSRPDGHGRSAFLSARAVHPNPLRVPPRNGRQADGRLPPIPPCASSSPTTTAIWPRLKALVEACAGLGEIDVVAPEQNASGTSNSLTLNWPLSAFTASNGYRYLNGTPSDCVHVALTGLLERAPGPRPPASTTAPTWATTRCTRAPSRRRWRLPFGLRAIAFSLVEKGWQHLDAAARVARAVVEQALLRTAHAGPGCSTSTFPEPRRRGPPARRR